MNRAVLHATLSWLGEQTISTQERWVISRIAHEELYGYPLLFRECSTRLQILAMLWKPTAVRIIMGIGPRRVEALQGLLARVAPREHVDLGLEMFRVPPPVAWNERRFLDSAGVCHG